MLKMTDFVLKYSITKEDIMINEEKQVCYNMQVYNDFVDFPFAMTNIEDFEFDKLLSHPNPEISCILPEYRYRHWRICTVLLNRPSP